ncbi:ABC transporter substrate-binding protein [Halothermothrix orenii]|uniref:Extracellular solute-binding protein family 1 n=1 Tax=Halothermothrix orenii (strain H 168 / OCM 544 / DSM 9562) TaxID=373903 RepID=B8CWN6_HALOH|nr:extracellular solute-binding protein [Halothermothrix orenii]ACL69705.1 extracellular solute-binding protein family 1 [Halothermothrix orenii H 168]
MKKSKLRGFLLVITVLLVIGLISGCGSKTVGEKATKDKQFKLTFFFYKSEIADAMETMARAFQEEHPNVVIKNEIIGQEYNTVLKTKDAAGQLPDIFAASIPGERALKDFIEAGKIRDVSDFKVMDNLSDDFKESLTFSDGNIYIIPLFITGRGIVYNEKLFKKAGIKKFPDTLEGLREACRKLKKTGITPFAAGAKDVWTLGSPLFQVGHEVMNPDGWVNKMYQKEASFKDYTLPVMDFVDLFVEYSQDNPLGTDYTESVVLYAREEAAMLVQGPWVMDLVQDLNPDVASSSHMAPIPFTNNPEKNKLYIDYDGYFCINSKTDKEVVNQYFDFMINGSGRKIFKEEIKCLNPFGITFETHGVNEDIITAIESGEVIQDTQFVKMPDNFFITMGTVLQEYIAGKLTREQVMEKLDAEWFKSMDK